MRELLNGCICCNLVGQLSDALFSLRDATPSLSRIVIETSGSAFPATLAMEVNRISRENPGSFTLDGVISVIDVENWKGYDDTSYTAKMQAKYTDLIVFNKWELAGEDGLDRALDRVGDLDVQVAWVKSRKGYVEKDIVLGIDGAMVLEDPSLLANDNHHSHAHSHDHAHDHQDEVEVLSVTLRTPDSAVAGVKLDEFEDLLLSAPKDEVYRIKGLVASSNPPPDSTGARRDSISDNRLGVYVLNWAFSRWTYTQLPAEGDADTAALDGACARFTFILARGESNKWVKKLEKSDAIVLEDGVEGSLDVKRIS